ncbi:hypothetical protein SAMN05421538_101148 [Paracoccus isoporae]|uniref:Lipoprotein n=1 Tax=Paracoccus isoporae TaxID=591205 RepID=A0A1G6T0M3_9RHOB|nr:hypothetical protein [Paracoccus isoporae]SDD22434.1 hypothetical protein SAMN05421538_101148 [Paracoccus isoporae]
MTGRGQISGAAIVAAMAVLAGCAGPSNGGLAQPPRAKPPTIPVRLEGPTADTSILAGVSTRSGEMLILENDGSVTKTEIDSDRGRATLRQSDAAMYSLTDILVTDDTIPLEDLPRPPTAQEIALKTFAERRRSALPARIVRAEPEMFRGNQVRVIGKGGSGAAELVSVVVQLREGVDESTAFAYATCTLAAWSRTTKTPYGRHIRTLSSERNGVLTVESVFTMSTDLPLGLRVMERDKTLQECRANGVPARVAVGPVEGTETNG